MSGIINLESERVQREFYRLIEKFFRQTGNLENIKYFLNYFMIKPDGAKYLNEVMEMLETENIKVFFFALRDWERVASILYDAHMEWTPNFSKIFKAYANVLRELYTNMGIVGVVIDTDPEINNKLFNLKCKVRANHRNGQFIVLSDFCKMGGREIEDLPKTTFEVITESGKKVKIKGINTKGFHSVHDLNILHCPDPVDKKIERELKVLSSSGVLDKGNILTPKILKEIIHYETFNFIKDL